MLTTQLTDDTFEHAINQPGALPAAALEQLITRVQDVDMAEVRQQLTPRTSNA